MTKKVIYEHWRIYRRLRTSKNKRWIIHRKCTSEMEAELLWRKTKATWEETHYLRFTHCIEELEQEVE